MKIFIVEDDRVLQLMLKKMVDHLGHIISGTAVEGSEAIKKIKETSPDLVLMDIQLKDEINGIQVIEILKNEIDIKVIYITGNSDNKFREKAKKFGYVDYLIKPISVDILKESISKADQK